MLYAVIFNKQGKILEQKTLPFKGEIVPIPVTKEIQELKKAL